MAGIAGATDFSEHLAVVLSEAEPTLPEAWYDLAEEGVYQIMMFAALLGMEHAQVQMGVLGAEGEADFAEFEVPGEPVDFLDAIDVLRSRVALEPDVYEELDSALRHRAFTVSRLAGLEAIERLQAIMAQSIEEGETMAQFVERAGADELLQRAGFAENGPWYWETVLRTNETSAYNVGRHTQYRAMESEIEALEFVGITDSRQSSICRAYSSPPVVRPVDDPIWSVITPPNHHACRSTVRVVLIGTTEAEGLVHTVDVESLPAPKSGFEQATIEPIDLREL